jgi:hypothetical protein
MDDLSDCCRLGVELASLVLGISHDLTLKAREIVFASLFKRRSETTPGVLLKGAKAHICKKYQIADKTVNSIWERGWATLAARA